MLIQIKYQQCRPFGIGLLQAYEYFDEDPFRLPQAFIAVVKKSVPISGRFFCYNRLCRHPFCGTQL
jgi:hypothetical protein